MTGGRVRWALWLAWACFGVMARAEPLGLPPVPIPADNPQTPDKIALGDKLFHEPRFSATGAVSCSTCHADAKAFTDSPLKTSHGINQLTGTRNAPTVANAAYFSRQFWDGRSPSLEDQALHPFVNRVEMGLPNHQPILQLIRADTGYAEAFLKVFGKPVEQIGMAEVTQAIASYERSLVFGDSPFDRHYFGGQADAMTAAARRGQEVFVGAGRCVSCHVIEQTQALFTDNRFHDIGIGCNRIGDDIPRLAGAFLQAKAAGVDVDQAVLSEAKTSELGRFAVSGRLDDLCAFKTPTLRNVAVTGPYMHDGSLQTLREVVAHYNAGGISPGDPRVNDFLSGGIRPLGLTPEQIDDLVAFLEALTSPRFATVSAGPIPGAKP